MTETPANLIDLFSEMGETGERMTAIGGLEASAGNLSVFVPLLDPPGAPFLNQGEIMLPAAAPELAGGWIIVSGAGCRLRDMARRPAATLCLLNILPGGEQAIMFAAGDVHPTSEFNSHLAIHSEHAGQAQLHTVLHTQPPFVTYLSHLPGYQDTYIFNRRLMRWEPETILVFPEGIGMLPFQVPGSPEMMAVTLAGLRRHRAVVWGRHGLVTRCAGSIRKAGDMVEYIETAAHYEYLNLSNPQPVEGLSDEDLRRVAERYNIRQEYF